MVHLVHLQHYFSTSLGAIVRATYYNPPYTSASKKLYGNRSICGKMDKVKCLGADNKLEPNPCRVTYELNVSMVDLCPGCKGDHIDLSRDAFQSIAHLSAGRIKIAFDLV
ncbi:hypothetical protein UlMin_040701 [Ulmus minor]